MKRLIFAIILIFVAVTGASARTALQFFADSAAIGAIPLITPYSRLDMVDYFVNNIPKPSENKLGGKAIILRADSTSMSFNITSLTNCTIDVAVAGNDTTLVLIETMQLPQHDSTVRLFDKYWNPKGKPMPAPDLDIWLTDEGRIHRPDVEALIPFVLFRAAFDHSDNSIVLTHSMDSYFVDKNDRAALARWLKPRIKLSSDSFKPVR